MDKLLSALFKAKKEIKPALKSAENPFYKSKYADLREIDHAVKSALENNGLLLIQTTRVGEGNLPILVTYLYHVESGQMISSEYPITYSKPDPQSIGSGLTYARRYQLACICGVITEDDDAEAAMARKETEIGMKIGMKKGQEVVTAATAEGQTKAKSAKQLYVSKLENAKNLIELQSLTSEVRPEWNTDEFKSFVKSLENKLKASIVSEVKELFNAEQVNTGSWIQKKGGLR